MLFSRKQPERLDPSPEAAAAPERPDETTRYRDAVPGERPQSFIDASLTIVGDLHAEGDVRLDGRICGNVDCAQLIVGRDAAITGAVTAEQAIVRGRITGTIRAPVVILQDTAHVESEITYGQLAIDDGATFEGAAYRSDNPLAEAAARSMEGLQRMMRAAEAAANQGRRGANAGAEGAAVAPPPPAALPAPAANGHDPAEHKPAAPPHT
jgi:cytoskeletal protein CcmA (bactofilin family)